MLEVLEVLEDKNQRDDNKEMGDKNKKVEEYQEEEITQQQGPEKKEHHLFECYYCRLFTPTKDKNEYQNHVESNHPEWPTYPSDADLKRLGIYSKGKRWEI